MAEELPDDMQDLLDQLDSVDVVTNELDDPGTPIIAAKAPGPTSEFDDALDELEDVSPPDGSVMRPVDERDMDGLIKSVEAAPLAAPVQSVMIDIEKYKQQLDQTTAEILDGCRSDRQEAQDIVNMLRDYMVSAGPSKALVDGLVHGIEVKANIWQNAIRILEANTKFVVAAKSQIKVENNVTVDGAELTNILEQESSDDV